MLPETIKHVDWSPGDEADANKCFQIYNEYVKNRRTVNHLAIQNLESSSHIRRRIRWAALVLKEETGDSEVVKQMADTALIDHINKLDVLINDYNEAVEERKKILKDMDASKNPTLPNLPSLRDYTGLLREKRLALMDLARIRGVLDGFRGTGGNDGKPINIIFPNINHGSGAPEIKDSVVVTQDGERS